MLVFALLASLVVADLPTIVEFDTVEELQKACKKVKCLQTFTDVTIGAVIDFENAGASTEAIPFTSATPDTTVRISSAPVSRIQQNAPWYLDRLDQESPLLDGRFVYTWSGEGVNVYVLDTGVTANHTEFLRDDGTSRVTYLYDVFDIPEEDDCEGHGTMVASLVAGKTFGVAKNATVYSIRTLDCDGNSQISTILKAFEFLSSNMELPAVVVCSFGTGAYVSDLINKAVNVVTMKGGVVVTSAGNQHIDACLASPGGAPSSLAIGAVTRGDIASWFSDFGPCVTVYAPGSNITGASFTGGNATDSMSGTSMSCPLAAGVAATMLQSFNVTSEQIKRFLNVSATVVNGLPLIRSINFNTSFPSDWKERGVY